ncbi:polymeric immunoglobulin receptor-like [Brienomyrus brachyistius]|uniref:polymeric immunoglobulin receptor-like n=1 Tax=Brienomyrus brachyistius TaxID=42636 RepID=UPI0020B3DCD6|nr:polymeric immunoglobulin receptor-like [Brienomyrus brachyistius]
MAPLLFLRHVFFIRLPEIGGVGEMDESQSLSIEVKGRTTPWTGCQSITMKTYTTGISERTDFTEETCMEGAGLASCTLTDQRCERRVLLTERHKRISVVSEQTRKREPVFRGLGSLTDSVMAPLIFLIHVFFIRLPGGDSVWTFRYLTAQSGESLTIPCFYHQKYKDHVKYWCRGSNWNYCSTLARFDSNQPAGKVSLSDDPAHLVFNVTMRNLETRDSDIYWCAVEIGGLGEMDDSQSLSIDVKDAQSVRTVSWVSAERGGSVTIPCYYDQKYKHHVKYWCRGSNWNSCSTLARSDSSQPAGKVSLSDDPAHLVFNVTMSNLQETDSDTYWCAVEIHRAADDCVYLQLMVMEAKGVSQTPKQGELTTALQQTESITSSAQQGDGLTSATNHPTGWAVTTRPSGALTSTTNEDSSTTQSPSQMLLLLILMLLLLLVATVMVIWILRRRTKTLISNRNRPSHPQTTDTGDELVYSSMVFKEPSAQSPSVDPGDKMTFSRVTLQDKQECPPSDVTYAAVVSKKDRIS